MNQKASEHLFIQILRLNFVCMYIHIYICLVNSSCRLMVLSAINVKYLCFCPLTAFHIISSRVFHRFYTYIHICIIFLYALLLLILLVMVWKNPPGIQIVKLDKKLWTTNYTTSRIAWKAIMTDNCMYIHMFVCELSIVFFKQRPKIFDRSPTVRKNIS